jgi:hypothetical protein
MVLIFQRTQVLMRISFLFQNILLIYFLILSNILFRNIPVLIRVIYTLIFFQQKQFFNRRVSRSCSLINFLQINLHTILLILLVLFSFCLNLLLLLRNFYCSFRWNLARTYFRLNHFYLVHVSLYNIILFRCSPSLFFLRRLYP